MHHISRLSEVLYVGLCREVGSPTEVRFRRELMDTEEATNKPMNIIGGFDNMLSGSRREGFRLRNSDNDFMVWFPEYKVICDPHKISLCRIPQHTVILMECDDLPPGFTRLNLLSTIGDELITPSCVAKENKIIISSLLFRNNNLKILQSRHAFFASSVPHGPCSSHIKERNAELDFLICLQSHHWPMVTKSWIQRCREEGWPSERVLSDILSGGFHVVPIGSSTENEEEWRISFSRAEQRVVYSMNHYQFLCYGLLKIFLTEVINFQNNSPILCSYFIKTIVFWVIQRNNSSTWRPENLLSYFWKCFQLLIYYVLIGECPNFFIPQNNMFRVKVTGSVQISLLCQLYDLYGKGIPFLLLSPTLRPYLSHAIVFRTLRVCTEENSIISSTMLDISFFQELKALNINLGFEQFAVYMNQIEKVIRVRLPPHLEVSLQCKTSGILSSTALMMQSILYADKNRTVYNITSKVAAMLKLSCCIGCVSDILYLAVYYYRMRRYEYSLNILQTAERKISVPFILYNKSVNIDMYKHYTKGMSLDNKFRRAVVLTIMIHNTISIIDELNMEQMISIKNGWPVIYIPPLVMLHMLFILNHHRLGDTGRSQQSLQNLQNLLLCDNRVYISAQYRDISWQILGICQQITGDYLGSLRSYQFSLRQYPFNRIQEATLLRMNTLLADF